LGVFGGLSPHLGQPALGSLSDSPNNNDTFLGHSRDIYGARLTWNSKGYYGMEVGLSVSTWFPDQLQHHGVGRHSLLGSAH